MSQHPHISSPSEVHTHFPQREEHSDHSSGPMMHGNQAAHTTRMGTTQPAATAGRERHHPARRGPSQHRSGCAGALRCMGQGAIRVVHTVVPPGGILSGAFNMASASIGAGILGLPSAGDSSGLVLAMIFLVIITYFSVFSMYILALAGQSTHIKSFEGMARWLFPYGKFAFSYWAAFIRWFHAFAGCVAYIISVGNCLGPIFDDAKQRHPGNGTIEYLATKQGLRVLTVVIWACVMLPLVIPKHIDSLRYASAIAIVFMVYFVIVVVIHSCRHGLPENVHNVRLVGNEENDDKDTENIVYLFRTGNSVVHTVGVFMFAYVCQINAYEQFWDFRSELRTTRNYTWAAFIGMVLCGTLYVLVCVFGYLDFGSKHLMGKSLLLMYHPLEEADVMLAYVGVMIKLCVAYALLTIAARNSVYYIIGFQHRYRNRPDTAAAPSPVTSEEPLSQRADDADGNAPKPMSAALASEEMAAPYLDGGLDNDGSAKPYSKGPSPGVADELAGDSVDRDFEDSTVEDTTYVDNIPFWKHLTVVMVLSVTSLLCGLFIPNINTVFGFAGAISGGFLAFVFPALFVMYSGNFSVAQMGWFTYLNTYLLLLCGVIGIVFGTGGTIYETI
ncbi:amino acid permease (AAT11) [Leptomonas seymouri]|uniref:Amino acid permease (AAT11) n=1 Tax=Leptomonas seymouri TaxID=5684 RepID=A0A0N1PA98_LEPSE|nr:amino acid permease (AAT11) [Leptomonas seymouri]|eukprot:KPI83170.1 amino acid permease (AAT11) [Leptomonas seymouri]